MWLFAVFLFLLLRPVQSQVARVDVVLGAYTIVALYDPTRPFPGRFMHATTEGDVMYLVAVPDDMNADKVLCRQSTTRQIVVNPRGCDSNDPTEAVEDFYCASGGELAIEAARDAMREQWTLRADSPLCVEPAACLGPVYLTSESWNPGDDVTDIELLKSRRGVYVVSFGGPTGEIPMITFIPVQTPRVNLTGDCEGGDGTYVVHATDSVEDAYNNVTYGYARQFEATTRRMYLRRDGRSFRVALGAMVSILSYSEMYRSNQTFAGIGEAIEAETISFDSLDPSGAPTGETCSMRFEVITATKPLMMIEPVVPDDLTYYKDLRGGGFVTSEGAFRRGAVDHLRRLVYPDLPSGVIAGGRVRFRSPGPFGQKYKVLPDAKYKDFEWSCDKFYPRAAEFDGIEGFSPEAIVVPRDVPDEFACNAPFPHVDEIEEKRNDPDEKMRQCRMLGGRTALATFQYCTFDVSTTLCRKGWFFFDEGCFYRPGPDETGLMAVQSDADAACARVHPAARAVRGKEVDAYLEFWIRDNFIFHGDPSCVESPPVRVLIDGQRCKCYSCNNATVLGVADECGCEIPEFPLCRYAMKDDYIAWNDQKFHPATLQILRDGQCSGRGPNDECLGLERYGRTLELECLPGSSGEHCTKRSCVDADATTLAGDSGGLYLKFSQKCQVHGSCVEGMVDTCFCNDGWGPPSTLGNDSYSSFPCAARALRFPARDSSWVLNNVTHFSPYGVCGGREAGRAVCDAATGLCTCSCSERVDMDPDGPGVEPAFDGATCEAPRPMRPPGGYAVDDPVVEFMCNGVGTLCPSGERASLVRLDGTIATTVDADACRGVDRDGCVCDDGYAGAACTVPVPKSSTKRVTFVSGGAYATLASRLNVKNVFVTPEFAYAGVNPLCTVTDVSVGDAYATPSDQKCVGTAEPGRYWCGPSGAWGTHVVVRTSDDESSCAIRALAEDHLPCGNHTNSRAARFFANEAYRDFGRYDAAQSQEFAQYGGTLTACMHDANHTGKLGRNRVSSRRIDADGDATIRACGESSVPPRGKPTDDGCACDSFAGFDFSGSEGCACATVNGELCGGVGRCVEPSHPYGRCAFDVADEANDPLAVPFAVASEASEAPVYAFNDVRDHGSILAIDGQSWMFERGHTAAIEGLAGQPVSYCYQNARIPVNVTHECRAGVRPVRVRANVTVHSHAFGCDESDSGVEACYVPYNYTTVCDPAFNCPAQAFCGGKVPAWNVSDCVEPISWEVDPDDERVLVSRRYKNAWVVCANATTLVPVDTTAFPYGEITECANPVYRWIDDALVGWGYASTRQCSGAITPHSNVKGAMYGLFENVIPGLDFTDEAAWTETHYRFLASLTNDRVCVDGEGEYVYDAMSESVLDRYAKSLIDQLGPEDVVETISEVTWARASPAVGDLVGSALTHVEGIEAWPGSLPASRYSFPRAGANAPLPSNVRRVTMTNRGSTAIAGIQIVGPQGRVCGTLLRPVLFNETVSMDCGDRTALESRREIDRRIFEAVTVANRTDIALAYVPSESTAWYVTAEWVPGEGEPQELPPSFTYSYRNTSAADHWRRIASSIVLNLTFPFNSPFEDECAALGGSGRAVEYPRDESFLQKRHAVHLAARRCTHTWQCKGFARDDEAYACVFDPKSSLTGGWANGDPAFEETVVGDEGGCKFSYAAELADPQFSGMRSVAGYEAEWNDAIAFEERVRADFPELVHVLVNASEPWTEARVKWTLPTASANGRPTDACGGGRGYLVRTLRESTRNLTLYDGAKYKRCAAVEMGGDAYYAAPDEVELDLHGFVSPTTGRAVDVVRGRVFSEGKELTVGTCSGETCPSIGLTCILHAASLTERVRTFLMDERVVVSQLRDFWTSHLLT